MRRIRLKFFLIAALSLFLVLFSIVTGFNVSSKVKLDNDAKSTCEFILNNINKTNPGSEPPSGDPEVFFRNRFFISTYVDGKLKGVDTSKIARISPFEAETLSNKIFASSSSEGFDGVYFFKKQDNGSSLKIIFLDRQMELDGYYNDLKVSSLIASGGYVVTLVLIYFLSALVIKPIEEANKKQKRFITDASHELKTPLTIINSNLSLIEMDKGNNEYTESIKRQTERLSEMTNELVLLSKLNEDDVRLNYSDIELDSLINESVKPYLSILKNKGIDLSLQIESGVNFKGDALLLSQLFNSLLDNMNKYASVGPASITLKKKGNSIEIIFLNKIDKESKIDLDSIFDRFYKADESRQTKAHSFGIGLSMAKAIVISHKGKINATIEDDNIAFKIIL